MESNQPAEERPRSFLVKDAHEQMIKFWYDSGRDVHAMIDGYMVVVPAFDDDYFDKVEYVVDEYPDKAKWVEADEIKDGSRPADQINGGEVLSEESGDIMSVIECEDDFDRTLEYLV